MSIFISVLISVTINFIVFGIALKDLFDRLYTQIAEALELLVKYIDKVASSQ